MIVFKLFFICGGIISWDIWSENLFYGDAQTDTQLGMTVFKLFIWGGKSWDIWSENLFYRDAHTAAQFGDDCIQTFYLGRYIMGYTF